MTDPATETAKPVCPGVFTDTSDLCGICRQPRAVHQSSTPGIVASAVRVGAEKPQRTVNIEAMVEEAAKHARTYTVMFVFKNGLEGYPLDIETISEETLMAIVKEVTHLTLAERAIILSPDKTQVLHEYDPKFCRKLANSLKAKMSQIVLPPGTMKILKR